MTPADVIKAYYAAFDTGNLDEVRRYLHKDVRVEEPSFLPYGGRTVVGETGLFDTVTGDFNKLFEPLGLDDIRYFELDMAVITNAIWRLKGRHTGQLIACNYQEYFDVRDERITLMRPFYQAAADMIAEVDAALAAGVSFSGRIVKHNPTRWG